MAKYPKNEVVRATAYLKKLFTGRNKTLYMIILRDTGKSQTIQIFHIKNNRPNNISAYVAKTLGYSIDYNRLAVRVVSGGGGIVKHLSHVLYNDEHKLSQEWL